jgi:hypothetical protein
MSFANPTPISIGMTGSFDDRQYRVAGRVVMGMDGGGEIYYWNEFNLVSDGGESATLVFEETERGGEWRLFTLFEPEFPMTAEDAATKRVNDQLNLDGLDVRVTLVDETRVYHIEGEAPEGVEVGDVAHYFNAETGNRMVVVSWTGAEVEYYRGVTVSAGMIASVFNLRSGELSSLSQLSGSSFLTSGLSGDGANLSPGAFVKLAGVVLLFAIIFASYVSCRSGHTRATAAKIPAPVAPLTLGSAGTLDGKNYRIQGHTVVEIAQVSRLYDRHEYHLFDDEGKRALLIYGLKPGDKGWFLFTPLTPLEPLTPARAAALRVGESVNVDGFVAPVAELFQSVLRQTEGAELPELKNGTIFFNFSTQASATPLLVRWNNQGIKFYRGSLVAAKDVTTAFGRKAGN